MGLLPKERADIFLQTSDFNPQKRTRSLSKARVALYKEASPYCTVRCSLLPSSLLRELGSGEWRDSYSYSMCQATGCAHSRLQDDDKSCPFHLQPRTREGDTMVTLSCFMRASHASNHSNAAVPVSVRVAFQRIWASQKKAE